MRQEPDIVEWMYRGGQFIPKYDFTSKKSNPPPIDHETEVVSIHGYMTDGGVWISRPKKTPPVR